MDQNLILLNLSKHLKQQDKIRFTYLEISQTVYHVTLQFGRVFQFMNSHYHCLFIRYSIIHLNFYKQSEYSRFNFSLLSRKKNDILTCRQNSNNNI